MTMNLMSLSALHRRPKRNHCVQMLPKLLRRYLSSLLTLVGRCCLRSKNLRSQSTTFIQAPATILIGSAETIRNQAVQRTHQRGQSYLRLNGAAGTSSPTMRQLSVTRWIASKESLGQPKVRLCMSPRTDGVLRARRHGSTDLLSTIQITRSSRQAIGVWARTLSQHS